MKKIIILICIFGLQIYKLKKYKNIEKRLQNRIKMNWRKKYDLVLENTGIEDILKNYSYIF